MKLIEPEFKLDELEKLSLSDIQRRVNQQEAAAFLQPAVVNSWTDGSKFKDEAHTYLLTLIAQNSNERPVTIVRLLPVGQLMEIRLLLLPKILHNLSWQRQWRLL